MTLTIDMPWLQMRLVTPMKVTKSSRSPNLVDIPLTDEIFDHLIFARSLDRHQVHALFATQIAGVQPTGFMALKWR